MNDLLNKEKQEHQQEQEKLNIDGIEKELEEIGKLIFK